MSIDFASQINLMQSGTSRIIGAGSMLQPYTPSFHAWQSNAVNTPAGNYVVCNAVIYNIGNWYNPANGLFSAPVAGVYYFTGAILSDSASAGQNVHVMLKNGTAIVGSYYIQQQPSGFLTRTCTHHVQMAANDYVGFYLSSGGATYAGGSWAEFGGYLVG